MNDRDRAALALLGGQCCPCPDPRRRPLGRTGPARPKVNGRPMTALPQGTEDSTAVFRPRLLLAPLLLPGAGSVAGLGARAPTFTARATGGYAVTYSPTGLNLAITALNGLGLPYPVRPHGSGETDLHYVPQLVGSTLNGTDYLMLYATAWEGQVTYASGMQVETSSVTGPAAYALVRVPSPGSGGAPTVVDAQRYAAGLTPLLDETDLGSGREGYFATGMGDHYATDRRGTAPTSVRSQRHLVVSTRPGVIRALTWLHYAWVGVNTVPRPDDWAGFLHVQATAGGIAFSATQTPGVPLNDQWVLGVTGENGDTLYWTGIPPLTPEDDNHLVIGSSFDGSRHVPEAALWKGWTAGQLLVHDWLYTRVVNGLGVEPHPDSARHNHTWSGPGQVTVNTHRGNATSVTANGLSLATVAETGFSSMYPGWANLVEGKVFLDLPDPAPVTVARTVRNSGNQDRVLRVEVGDAAHLRSGDTLGGAIVTGATDRWVDVYVPPGGILEKDSVLSVTPNKTVPWDSWLAPRQVKLPEPDYLPSDHLLPASTTATPPGQSPKPGVWRRVKALADLNPDVRSPGLTQPALRGKAGGLLTITWPDLPPDPLAVFVLTLTVRLARPGTLSTPSPHYQVRWPQAPAAPWEISLGGRIWTQLRSLPITALDGVTQQHVIATADIDLSSVMLERLR